MSLNRLMMHSISAIQSHPFPTADAVHGEVTFGIASYKKIESFSLLFLLLAVKMGKCRLITSFFTGRFQSALEFTTPTNGQNKWGQIYFAITFAQFLGKLCTSFSQPCLLPVGRGWGRKREDSFFILSRVFFIGTGV